MRNYLRAISYFRDDVPQIVVSLALIGMSSLLGLLQPFPLAILLDAVLDHKQVNQWAYRAFTATMGTRSVPAQILMLALVTLGIRLACEVLRMVQTLLNLRISYNGLMRMRCELFRKLQQLSLTYHRSQPQGDAIYRLSSDTFGFQTILGVGTTVVVQIVTLVCMAGIMWGLSRPLTLLALAVIPPLVMTIKIYARVLQQRSLATKEVDAELTTTIQRSVASIGLVQAFGREADEYDRFASTVRDRVNTWLKLHWQEAVYWLVIGTILGIGGAAIFGYGAYLVHQGRLEMGLLTVFLFYLGTLYDLCSRLTSSGPTMQTGAAGVQRVFEVLDRQPNIHNAVNATELPRQPRTLELEHVSFAYDGGEPVLMDVNVCIKPGQMVAFVGSSGVGKSTLLNLLPRFYDPTVGRLLLDGHDLRDVRLSDLRRHIAMVLQESPILPTDIAENIAYGRPQATAAQIARAARLAGADEFIQKLPRQYQTLVAEAGQNLSGGQRQRIAIARAILTEAPIMVFDEPTSALDPEQEHAFTQMLADLKHERTIMIVSHRLSTVAGCDQIFVMEEGRIVESGTHEQLLGCGGLYAQMAAHQLQGSPTLLAHGEVVGHENQLGGIDGLGEVHLIAR